MTSESKSIMIKCMKCGFEEKPENFNGILAYDLSDNRMLKNVYVQCPICGATSFFQHFLVDTRTCLSPSHLIAVTLDEAKTPKEAKKIYELKLKQLRKQYKKE